tara:strand:+ start:226 stop:426 length:201 start_codon:yes stop_codon:yes gene_type:complete
VKPGDLVRIRKSGDYAYSDLWPEYHGKLGLIVKETNRLYIPAALVSVMNLVIEFDLEELELVNESR